MGPIGLGFRVPMIVMSPFSRGGFLCSDTFDHTSMLRFLETRFGVEVPNLSAWRREVTGDLTSAFNFAGAEQARAGAAERQIDETRSPERRMRRVRPGRRAAQLVPRRGRA